MNDSTSVLNDKQKYIKTILEKASDHSKNEIVKATPREQIIAKKASSTLDDLSVNGKIIISQPEPIAEKIKKSKKPVFKITFSADDLDVVD